MMTLRWVCFQYMIWVHLPFCGDIVLLLKELQIWACRLHQPEDLLPSGDSIKGSRAGKVDMPRRETLVIWDQQIIESGLSEVPCYIHTLICKLVSIGQSLVLGKTKRKRQDISNWFQNKDSLQWSPFSTSIQLLKIWTIQGCIMYFTDFWHCKDTKFKE